MGNQLCCGGSWWVGGKVGGQGLCWWTEAPGIRESLPGALCQLPTVTCFTWHPQEQPPPFRKPQKDSQGSCLPNDEDRDGMVNRCFFLFVFLFLLVPFILFLSPPDNGNNLRTLLRSRLLIIFNFPNNSKGGLVLPLLLCFTAKKLRLREVN